MVIAKKSLGQNFLQDQGILDQIIDAAELTAEDHVLEIGPGKGALTDRLIEQAGKVTAVELDDRLIPFLKIDYGKHDNFELVHADALTYEPPSHPYKIVANIPYYITSPLLNHYLMEQFQSGNPPKTIVFMVQKEVAEKIVAKKGKHSVLSLQVHLFGEPELVCVVPKTAFKPAPKVESAVIKITVHDQPKLDVDLKKLFWLFKVCFAQKRKKLSKNLASVLRVKPAEIREELIELGIDENARAEQLTMDEWMQLYNAYAPIK
mgnify:CR=1 FL=1